jgi:hypothetical protein
MLVFPSHSGILCTLMIYWSTSDKNQFTASLLSAASAYTGGVCVGTRHTAHTWKCTCVVYYAVVAPGRWWILAP